MKKRTFVVALAACLPIFVAAAETVTRDRLSELPGITKCDFSEGVELKEVELGGVWSGQWTKSRSALIVTHKSDDRIKGWYLFLDADNAAQVFCESFTGRMEDGELHFVMWDLNYRYRMEGNRLRGELFHQGTRVADGWFDPVDTTFREATAE